VARECSSGVELWPGKCKAVVLVLSIQKKERGEGERGGERESVILALSLWPSGKPLTFSINSQI
jgi:hypothetical protein